MHPFLLNFVSVKVILCCGRVLSIPHQDRGALATLNRACGGGAGTRGGDDI